jgi:hypothetical protein
MLGGILVEQNQSYKASTATLQTSGVFSVL